MLCPVIAPGINSRTSMRAIDALPSGKWKMYGSGFSLRVRNPRQIHALESGIADVVIIAGLVTRSAETASMPTAPQIMGS